MESRKTTSSFRRELQERYGTKCHICGEDGAEYHHIIPLWMGGEDIVENFIPLCRWHHMLLHNAVSRRPKGAVLGRKQKVDKNGKYKYILDDYVNCRIGTAECKAALGLTDGTAISDRVWFRAYLKEKGIKKHRNNIDLIRKKSRNGKHKDVVGWIEFESGERRNFYWGDMRAK